MDQSIIFWSNTKKPSLTCLSESKELLHSYFHFCQFFVIDCKENIQTQTSTSSFVYKHLWKVHIVLRVTSQDLRETNWISQHHMYCSRSPSRPTVLSRSPSLAHHPCALGISPGRSLSQPSLSLPTSLSVYVQCVCLSFWS